MYGKFDKYDLFKAAKDCRELWQKNIDRENESYQENDSYNESIARIGYFTIKNIIISHGLENEFCEWLEAQQ